MGELFITVFNMSYQASIVIIVIFLARLMLRLIKAPKKYSYFLWAIPFVRLVCPFTLESFFSLMPRKHSPVSPEIVFMQTPQVDLGVPYMNQVINESLPAATPYASMNPMQVIMMLVQLAWLGILVIILLYSLFSYLYFKKNLSCSIRLEENIYLADYIRSPFVIGIWKPRIYLPSALQKEEMIYVLKHEKTHIRRGDHIIKMLAFLITCVHWFNPFGWAAYLCLCRDMEMSCDEKVITGLDGQGRSRYAQVLLQLSVSGTGAGIPLAFGEGNTKSRIRNIANYKKAAAAAGVTAVAVIAVLIACLLTNPSTVRTNNEDLKAAIQSIPEDTETIYLNQLVPFQWTQVYTFDPYLDVDRQAEIMGVSSRELKESVNEGMVHFVFVNEDKVVSSICAYREDLGYDLTIRTIDYQYLNTDYMKLSYEDNPVFTVSRKEGMTGITYLTGSGDTHDSEPIPSGEGETEAVPVPPERLQIEIKPASVISGQITGANGVSLDYAGRGHIIFHDYFGLFVYSLDNKDIIGAVDLAAIGCDATQGDQYCEVFVSRDGQMVYLDPYASPDMYIYDVVEQKLYQTKDYKIEEELFDSFAENDEFADGNTGVVSQRGVKFVIGGIPHYGFLTSDDGTIDTLCYVLEKAEGTRTKKIQELNVFGEILDRRAIVDMLDKLNSGLFGMSVEEDSVTASGASFRISNHSSQELTYGDDFKLQRKENEKWKDVPYIIDNGAFNDIAYWIKAGDNKTIEVNWEWLYGKLEKGSYLFIKEISGVLEGEEAVKIPLGAEFRITDE